MQRIHVPVIAALDVDQPVLIIAVILRHYQLSRYVLQSATIVVIGLVQHTVVKFPHYQ